jgi:hypothetical protein
MIVRVQDSICDELSIMVEGENIGENDKDERSMGYVAYLAIQTTGEPSPNKDTIVHELRSKPLWKWSLAYSPQRFVGPVKARNYKGWGQRK